jgi:carbamoyl-phosphate synthase large subunit
MLRFLITGVGGDVAQGICRVIRESFGDVVIVGSDVGDKHAGLLFVDFFKLVPRADSNTYITSIKSLVKEFNIDMVIPTSEPEIEILTNLSKSILPCKILTPGRKVVRFCMDKFETNRFLDSIELDVPWTIKSDDGLPEEYPCIFKGSKGAGSKLLYVVKDELEARYLKKRHSHTIFQELLLPDDKEITCAVFRSNLGSVAVLQLQRSLVGGATSWARVIFEPDIDRICRLIAKELELVGSMNIQLRLTKDGPRIFEINPRFSSTVYMRYLIGFNDVLWSINDHLGIESRFPGIPVNTELVRIFDSKILVSKVGKVN